MPHSDQLPNPSSNAEVGWSWLQSRLERTELLAVSHEFDEWIEGELTRLESNYESLVTHESERVSAGSLVKTTRRKG
jgi:hypothetical protein